MSCLKSNKHKAMLILVIFTLGFLISYPFSKNNFWIGLISGACSASMIGGLADWFAVTAIFRRPLKMYWPRKIFRTEIIPKNRESIVKGLVDIVENELLSKENIKKKILDINMYEMLIKYIEEKSTDKELNSLFRYILNNFYRSLEDDKLEALLNSTFKVEIERFNISAFMSELIAFIRENGYDDELIDFSLDMFIGFIKHNKTHLVFTNFVEEVIKEYEGESSSRAMTIKMLLNFVLKKSPSDIAKMLENGIVDAIYEVKNIDNENRAKIKSQIDGFSNKLNYDMELRNNIEKWKNTNTREVTLFTKRVINSFKVFKEKNYDLSQSKIGAKLDSIFKNTLKDVINNSSDYNERFDSFIKEAIISFVNKKHSTIGTIVRDRINQFSTEELVELIENIAGNDLQMIRINGSVVGGLVGIITYLLTYYIR